MLYCCVCGEIQDYSVWQNKTPTVCQQCNAKSKYENINHRIAQNMRSRIRYTIKNQNGIKKSNTADLTGCTIDELKSHLESQFSEGMTWENYGQWHIDHIRPCASFDLTDPEQQKQCFHYTNLQPLWAIDNMKKSDKWEG